MEFYDYDSCTNINIKQKMYATFFPIFYNHIFHKTIGELAQSTAN